MILFEEGHDRKKDELSYSEFQAPLIDPKQIAVDNIIPHGYDAGTYKKEDKTTTNVANTKEIEQPLKFEVFKSYEADNARASEVHNPKNSLSALVKNAERNKKTFEERNKRIKESNQASKRQYGW
ncbi:hypothetical protein TPHA_0F03550 [Tetrapisispora phaffii CBS 4417]|uniref:Uncharacterized protein n=1 Tax=Tetrapisispora phaffii (strain ATCC 24235 / CBS 4417 / NBRC 1672 / NRRL Y-8282 / UCD 70-5) TaxID=1071381 RepID=G8BUP9_TETPH|nr:hypothetical protein TPHA_0F03550 [Tetrapisispora phaffii CBS 4417]CCE63835.1 hypothetical protein TPHA_0F03550 [Tetrapisispora phaffii CBS 4417]